MYEKSCNKKMSRAQYRGFFAVLWIFLVFGRLHNFKGGEIRANLFHVFDDLFPDDTEIKTLYFFIPIDEAIS